MKARLIVGLFVVACLAIPATAQIPLPPIWPNNWVNVVDDFGMSPTPSMFPESYIATTNEKGIITDLYVVGDSYTVFVNGKSVLTTPVVPDWTTYGFCGGNGKSAPCAYDTDPNVALLNPDYSSGYFYLKKGDIVTIQENTLPTGYTDGTYAITASVPEPGTLLLIGTGALGLLGAVRRKLNL